MNKYIRALIIIGVAFAALFLARPDIDIYITGLFYNDEERFFLDSRYVIFEILHKSVRYITITTAMVCLGLLFVGLLKKKDIAGIAKKKLAYIILALIIGPGLIVNTVFKDNWGRARPHHTVEFGGDKTFTPPFIISDQCDRNCSFVSGDPSVGFFFISCAFVFASRRREFFVFSMLLGTTLGITRVVQGAHFTSDVIFSAIFTVLSCYFLHKIMFREKNQSKTTE